MGLARWSCTSPVFWDGTFVPASCGPFCCQNVLEHCRYGWPGTNNFSVQVLPTQDNSRKFLVCKMSPCQKKATSPCLLLIFGMRCLFLADVKSSNCSHCVSLAWVVTSNPFVNHWQK